MSTETEHFNPECILLCPPSKKRGYIILLMSVCPSVCMSVCPSTRWFPDDNSRTLRPRIMKLHRYIDHDSQMTPIDFQVTRSKVKVTVPKNAFTQWLPLQLTAHMGGRHVLQTALVYLIFQNRLQH